MGAENHTELSFWIKYGKNNGKKQILKITIDVLMTIILLLLMGFQITGQLIHEWLGIGMFTLWIIHHFLNRKWGISVFKGRYTPYRIVQSIINALLIFCMIGLMYSGITLSRYAFPIMNIHKGVVLTRKIHLLASNWSFILMSVHIGMHWNGVIIAMRKNRIIKYPALLRILAVAFAVYGVICFFGYHITENLFLLNEFAFFDYEQSVFHFFAGYTAIMELFIFLAYELMKDILCKKINFTKEDDQ